MDYIPKRLIYGEFPSSGFYGITARQALEASIDGDLTAYQFLSTHFSVQEWLHELNPLGRDLGRWHGLTVQVPIYVLYSLNFYETHCIFDFEGKPSPVLVNGPLGTPDMRPDIEDSYMYCLWPQDQTVTFDRARIFFLRDDLRKLAEGTLPLKPKSGKASPASGQPDLEIERPSQILLIAALLDLAKTPRTNPTNQEGVKTQLLDKFKWRGLSKRSIENMFAEANRAVTEAEKGKLP